MTTRAHVNDLRHLTNATARDPNRHDIAALLEYIDQEEHTSVAILDLVQSYGIDTRLGDVYNAVKRLVEMLREGGPRDPNALNLDLLTEITTHGLAGFNTTVGTVLTVGNNKFICMSVELQDDDRCTTTARWKRMWS